jgi:hypothetical protein
MVSACVLASGCFDALAPGTGQLVDLAFYPVFDGHGPLDGAPSDVDSFRIVVNNPPRLDTVYVRLPPGQDSIELRVRVTVSSGPDTVTIGFEGYSSVTGLLLYSGTQDIEVHGGIPGPPQPINASYVGPGQGIRSLVVNPRQVALAPGATQLLTYTGFDTANVVMPDDSVPVHYLSRNLGTASVDASGRVLAVADGTVFVVVVSVARSSIRDSARVTVTSAPAPLIGLAPTSITFNGAAGGSNPAAQTVAVSNAGGQTLTGLAVGTITYGAGGTGWLTASLGGTTAPATLTLTAATGTLAAGTYTATVPVTAAGVSNSPQNVSVSFVVVSPPTIVLAPTTITFNGTLTAANPAAQTVSVTNSGSVTLSGLATGTITYGASQPTGWLTASLGGTTAPATLTLNASLTGLTAGTYTATVPVTSAVASNSPQTVAVTFVVAPPPLVSIAVAPGFSVLLTTGTVTLSVTGRNGAGASTPVTGLAFVSRSPAVATVNAATGLVTGVTGGTAVIVASAVGASGTVFDSMTVAVAATGAPVASAIGDGRAFDVVRPGDTVRVLVQVDLRRISPDKLGSYNAQLDWNTTALRYVRTDPVSGGFAAATLNETATTSGQLRFGAANAAGSAGPTVGLVTVVFVGNAVGTSALTFTLTDLSGISPAFTKYLPPDGVALIYSGSVRVQ